jgi:hypothetical protein
MKDHSAANAHAGLAAMVAEMRRTWERDFLLAQIQPTSATPSPLGPKSLIFGSVVARSSIERTKPDAERDALYMERNITRQRDRLDREQKNFFAPADRALFASFVKRAQKLPAEQRIAGIDRLFANATDEASILRRIDELYAQTKMFDRDERLKMFGESEAQLRARKDPLVDLGFELDRDLRVIGARKDELHAARFVRSRAGLRAARRRPLRAADDAGGRARKAHR